MSRAVFGSPAVRFLVVQLCKREIHARYKGSLLGLGWSFLSPLLMLAMYSLVFAGIMRSRWPGMPQDTGSGAYVVMLFSGLVLHGFLAECLVRGPTQITHNVNYVKKVVFPLPVIALSQWGALLFHFLISLVLLLALQWWVIGSLPPTLLLLPLVLLPMGMLGLGLMWGLSAIGVFFRDISQLVGVVATLLLFMSPALYPLSAVPETYRGWYYLNPLTSVLECFRDLTVFGVMPDAAELAITWAMGGGVLLAGAFVFHRLRHSFADVL